MVDCLGTPINVNKAYKSLFIFQPQLISNIKNGLIKFKEQKKKPYSILHQNAAILGENTTLEIIFCKPMHLAWLIFIYFY